MKQAFFVTCIISMLSITAFAQKDEAGVKTCLEHYMSGEGNRVEQAFHPSATMKFIDYQTGEFKDMPIADYIARVKTNSSSGAPRPSRKIEIISMNIEGTAAQAKIKIETDKNILYDYMNLLKVNGEWKIVSKIFNRQDK
ncbi:MAG TPA: nuclear transport factor 2 family protein [Flavisolibacter sp.]|nr:nuclear transport factor 2 family protein [Flavisolibacter sp.]